MSRHWNYRVVRREYGEPHDEGEGVSFGIHETHYHADGRVRAVAVEPTSVASFDGSYADLRGLMARLARAMERPVIDYATLDEVPCGLLQNREVSPLRPNRRPPIRTRDTGKRS